MQVPADATISIRKLTHYLLVPRVEDDKSKFLARAGFHLNNFEDLEQAIRKLTAEEPAIQDGANRFGAFFRIDGWITGPNDTSLPVTLIWIQWFIDGSFHFVTLKPRRAKP